MFTDTGPLTHGSQQQCSVASHSNNYLRASQQQRLAVPEHSPCLPAPVSPSPCQGSFHGAHSLAVHVLSPWLAAPVSRRDAQNVLLPTQSHSVSQRSTQCSHSVSSWPTQRLVVAHTVSHRGPRSVSSWLTQCLVVTHTARVAPRLTSPQSHRASALCQCLSRCLAGIYGTNSSIARLCHLAG